MLQKWNAEVDEGDYDWLQLGVTRAQITRKSVKGRRGRRGGIRTKMRHRTGSPLFSCFVLLYCLHFVLGQYYGGYGLGYPYGMMGGGGYGMGGGYGLGGYSGYGGYGGDYGYGARPVMVRRVIYTMPGYGGGYGGYGGYGAYGGGMYPGIYGAKTVAAKV